MTVEHCLKLAKQYAEGFKDELGLSVKADPALAQMYLERARRKVAKYPKYKDMEIVGLELKKKSAKPTPKPKKEKEDGKKST